MSQVQMREKNMEQRGGGGEKKCLPRAIYPPPIIKSHRHDPIRRWEADGVKILKTYGIMKVNMGSKEGNMGSQGGQYGVIRDNDPMEPFLTTFDETAILRLLMSN